MNVLLGVEHVLSIYIIHEDNTEDVYDKVLILVEVDVYIPDLGHAI